MSLFKDMLKDNESLFVDEIALDFDFIPKTLRHRENEQKYIATCINPLLSNRNGKNLLVTGTPGIGKTASIKWVLRELKDESDSVYPIYINCWKHDTVFKIIMSICEQIGYKFTHNKKTDELLNDVSNIINKKSAVFVLDEIDKIKEEGMIYNLLEEIYRKTIILITNDSEFLSKLDSRVKSRLLAEVMEFRPYNYEETKSILKERRDHAFVNGIWDEEGFGNIVDKSYELKDIRTGLHLMKESGTLAENKASRKITKEFCDNAIEKLNTFKIKNSNTFIDDKKDILELIKTNSGKSIKDLHNLLLDKNINLSYRTFFNRIKDLENSGVIYTKEKEGPGKSTIVNYGSKKLENS